METNFQPLKEFLSGIITPNVNPELNINVEHHTVLFDKKPSKSSLQSKQQTSNAKGVKLRKNDCIKLGLYTLPTHQMKYTDALALHNLWKGYMLEHLGLRAGSQVPKVSDNHYEAFSKLLIKTDLHGAKIHVIRSKCPSLVNLSGICVLDTKNTFKLLGKDNRLRTIPKTDSIFMMHFANMEFTMFGKYITIRPAERSTKKIKNNMEPDI